jgi:predicted Zn finger-like uncharacterized protein
MPQNVTCPKCRAGFAISSKQLGTRVKCPKCKADFTATAPTGKSAPGVAPTAKSAQGVSPVGKSAQGVATRPSPTAKSAQGIAKPGAARQAGKTSPSASGESDFAGMGGGGELVSLAPGFRKPPGKISLFMKKLKRIVMILLIVGVVGGGLTFAAIKLEPWNMLFASKETGKETAPAPETKPATKKEEPIDPDTLVNTSGKPGQEDLLAYVPPDSSLIVGFDTAAIQREPVSKPFFDRQLVNLGLLTTLAECKTRTGMDVNQLFERLIVTFGPSNGGQLGPMTLIIQSAFPFHQPKLGQWAAQGQLPKKFNDRYYYEKHQELPQVKCVYMPSNRIIVLSELQPPQLSPIFETDGSKLPLAAPLVALVRQVEKNQAWGVMPISAATKADLQAGKGIMDFLNKFTPANIQATINKVVPDARAMTFRATLAQGPIDLGFGVVCKDKPQSDELFRAVQNSWNQQKVAKLKTVRNSVVLEGEDRQKLVNGLADSLQFVQQDTLVEVNTKTTFDLLKSIAKDGPDTFATQFFELAGVVTNELKMNLLPERAVVLTNDQKAFLDKMNEVRKNAQATPYKPNAKLMDIAQSHAAKMAKEEKLDDDIDGKDTVIRVKDKGYLYKKDKLKYNLDAGENLEPAKAVDMWVKDELRKELVFGEYAETGVGIAKGASGKVYYYQIYADPEK